MHACMHACMYLCMCVWVLRSSLPQRFLRSDPNQASMVSLEIKSWGDFETLCKPCVDCGKWTGNWCELECLASACDPNGQSADGQITPHCTECDRKYGMCHFCRGLKWVQPPAWGDRTNPSDTGTF